MQIGCLGVAALLLVPLAPAQDTTKATPFLLGGDISMIPRFEELGAVYRADGEAMDSIHLMMDHGATCFRVRLFVNPTMRNAVIQDLDYAIKLGRRIQEAGAVFLLDFHYSDTWADPGKQFKPAAWQELEFEALTATVEDYTANVIHAFREAGCLPELVQVGNEIRVGMLWPDGKLDESPGSWERFSTLLKAGIRGVRRPLGPDDQLRIMVHSDQGADPEQTDWFFRHLQEHDVAFDVIGLSYYPWWHGTLAKLKENLSATAKTFGKDIVVVEAAYPWREDREARDQAWPMTPDGQKQYLADVIAAVRATPDGRGKGVIWWYPESIPVQGLRVWKGGACALFDADGNALPALDAFRGPATGEPKVDE